MEQSRAAVSEEPAKVIPSSPSPAPPPPPAALEYDRSPNHVTRGQFRILLLMVFVNTVAIVGYVVVPGGSQWARQTWADFQNKRAAKAKEQRARDAISQRIADFQKALPAMAKMKLTATTTPDAPVYTEDGVEAASLLASDANYQTVRFDRGGHDLRLWQPAVGRAPLPEAATLLRFIGTEGERNMPVFLHARKNPVGEARLVLCEVTARQQVRSVESDAIVIGTDRVLLVRLIAPGSSSEPPRVLASVQTEFNQRPGDQARVKTRDSTGRAIDDGSDVTSPQVLRLLSGVADPADATRCTIPYVIGGVRGQFVIRIEQNDQLTVEPSDGRVAERSGGRARIVQRWDPAGVPAIRVSETPP
jgi:hypothetical protein